ncbi:FAD-binding protein [Novosphingobium colocasiae]
MVPNPPLDNEYDLVIVGSGGGSMAAALAAQAMGKSVVILEKAGHGRRLDQLLGRRLVGPRQSPVEAGRHRRQHREGSNLFQQRSDLSWSGRNAPAS